MLLPKAEDRSQPLSKPRRSVWKDLQKTPDGTKKPAVKRREPER